MIPQFEILGIIIPTYLFIISTVYCLGIFYFLKRIKCYNLSPSIATDLLLLSMISGFIGARLFYVFYQEWSYFSSHLLEVIQFWNGGFVYYGGLLSGIVACYLYLNHKKESLGQWMDAAAPVMALGYGLGRLACFFNGCCYGGVCLLPWAVKFPHLHDARHPTQIYAVLFELLVWVLLIFLERKGALKFKGLGLLFYSWLVAHGCGRIVMEYFRADPRGSILAGFSISTWISLLLIGFGVFQIYRVLNKSIKE